jgi:hypothetical protein
MRDDKLFCCLIIKLTATIVNYVLYNLCSAEKIVMNWSVDVVLIIVFIRSQLLCLCVHASVMTAVDE